MGHTAMHEYLESNDNVSLTDEQREQAQEAGNLTGDSDSGGGSSDSGGGGSNPPWRDGNAGELTMPKDKYTEEPQTFDEEGDWMAFAMGLGHGFMRLDPKPEATEAAKRNKYYYYPGYIIGYLLKVAAVIGVAKFGPGVM